MSDEQIMGLNLPTGIPFVYELDESLKPVPNGSLQFLGDEETVKKAIAAVAAQGKAKWNHASTSCTSTSLRPSFRFKRSHLRKIQYVYGRCRKKKKFSKSSSHRKSFSSVYKLRMWIDVILIRELLCSLVDVFMNILVFIFLLFM